MRRGFCFASNLLSIAGSFGLWRLFSIRNGIDSQNKRWRSGADRLYADLSVPEQNLIIMIAFLGLLGVLFGYIGLTMKGATSKFEMIVTSVLSLTYLAGIALLFSVHFMGAQ